MALGKKMDASNGSIYAEESEHKKTVPLKL
jgi:hypothetical protein